MAASCALITLLGEDEGRTTIDLTVHYLAPAKGDLTAVATVRRRGGRTAIIDVELTAMDTLAAIGRATFAILRESDREKGR
jgi:acyl-coenzyme A thioesterase PaaI-like protein